MNDSNNNNRKLNKIFSITFISVLSIYCWKRRLNLMRYDLKHKNFTRDSERKFLFLLRCKSYLLLKFQCITNCYRIINRILESKTR